MIGVVAPASDQRVVAEFFELFKTPWEYLRSGCKYDVVLCIGEADFDWSSAGLVLCYADHSLQIDVEEEVEVACHSNAEVLSYGKHSLVIYGNHLTFREGNASLVSRNVDDHWFYRRNRNGATVNRIGYDLFAETAKLLTSGQPVEFAELPTLELHISLLRDMIVESGVELIEIPPVPLGHGCIACLTHDVDHPAIRNHKWDATAFGFLYRATAGSLANFLRGRIPFTDVVKNLSAAIRLPFVYIGLAKDFWSGFEDRYSHCEQGIPSTYFVIPFRDCAGNDVNGRAPARRAARYAAKDIEEALCRIRSRGCEVALHGIDAWRDNKSASKEFQEVRQVTQDNDIGVRMHWLFFDDKSPIVLERAGASYDSTIGYRDTVGFRNGTTQAYKPIEAERLLELPMHVMDTALFYPAYLGLTQSEAKLRVGAMVATVAEFGGCLTVNWHDRSLTAERNWGPCYRALLDDLRKRKAWFTTAGQASAWFRMRRSVVFEADAASLETKSILSEATGGRKHDLPGLQLKVYNPHDVLAR